MRLCLIRLKDSHSLRQLFVSCLLSKPCELNERRILSANSRGSHELLSNSASSQPEIGRVPFPSDMRGRSAAPGGCPGRFLSTYRLLTTNRRQ
jgi:hypothetical protein